MGNEPSSHELRLRTIERTDHARVLAVIEQWWGGRTMGARLSPVFFVHFRPTSFLFEYGDELLACCQIIADCNPAWPNHSLLRRAAAGKLLLLESLKDTETPAPLMPRAHTRGSARQACLSVVLARSS